MNIYVIGEIGIDTTLKTIREQIQAQKPDGTYKFLIDTNGGCVYEGFAIRDFILKLKKTAEVETHVIGICYSIGTIIQLSADKEKRFISPIGEYMVHQPFLIGDICSDPEVCNADFLEANAKEVRKYENLIKKVYAESTGLSEQEISNLIQKTTFLTAKDSIDLGFCSEYSEVKTERKIFNIKKPIVKMNKQKTTLEKLKNILREKLGLKNETKKEEKKEIQNVQTALADGTEVFVDTESEELVGAMITYVETGEPLSNGDYALQDGTMIRVENGIIVEEVEENLEEILDEMTEELQSEIAEEMQNELSEEFEDEVEQIIQNALQNFVKQYEKNANAEKSKQIAKSIAKNKIKNLKKQIEAKQKLQNAKSSVKYPYSTKRNKKMTEKEQVFLQALGVVAKKYGRNIKNAIINPGPASTLSYTYNGIEDVNVFFYQPTIATPDFKKVFRILSGVKSKQQLFYANSLSKIVKKNAGNCDTTPTGNSTTIANRTLETVPMRVELPQCADTFWGAIFENWLKKDLQEGDLTATEIETIILNLVRDALRRDWFRIFSFGDTSSLNDDYNQLDGLWTLLFDVASTGVAKVNNAITVLNNVAGTTAEDYLRQLSTSAPNVLKQVPASEKRFWVTQNVWENLMTQYENKQGVELSFRYLQDGQPFMTFRGVEVVNVIAWDDSLADAANPLNATKNTLMLYGVADNIVVGIDGEDGEQQVDFWYDKNEDKMRVRGKFRLGVQYAADDLLAISSGLV